MVHMERCTVLESQGRKIFNLELYNLSKDYWFWPSEQTFHKYIVQHNWDNTSRPWCSPIYSFENQNIHCPYVSSADWMDCLNKPPVKPRQKKRRLLYFHHGWVKLLWIENWDVPMPFFFLKFLQALVIQCLLKYFTSGALSWDFSGYICLKHHVCCLVVPLHIVAFHNDHGLRYESHWFWNPRGKNERVGVHSWLKALFSLSIISNCCMLCTHWQTAIHV